MKRKLIKKLVLIVVAGMCVCTVATADMLELLDGTIITGNFMGGTQNTIRFKVGEEIQTYPKEDVLAITFMAIQPKAAAPAPQPTSPPATPQPSPAPAQPKPTPAAPQVPRSVTIPAGTRIMVRTNEALDSSRHGTGHMFTASLAADLVGQGQVVARKGTNVFGRLDRAKKSGRMAGQAELKIVLTDIRIDGKPYPLHTSAVRAKGEKTGAKTARNVGVASGIGALARGSKGAKRGAAVGLGASVLTSGSQVKIPTGTLLEFTLASPFVYAP